MPFHGWVIFCGICNFSLPTQPLMVICLYCLIMFESQMKLSFSSLPDTTFRLLSLFFWKKNFFDIRLFLQTYSKMDWQEGQLKSLLNAVFLPFTLKEEPHQIISLTFNRDLSVVSQWCQLFLSKKLRKENSWKALPRSKVESEKILWEICMHLFLLCT